MTKEYTPKGKIVKLLQAMEESPERCWSLQEAGDLMKTPKGGVLNLAKPALVAGLIHRGKDSSGGGVILRKTEFTGEVHIVRAKKIAWVPADDMRIPRVVAGWRPPVMVPVRG